MRMIHQTLWFFFGLSNFASPLLLAAETQQMMKPEYAFISATKTRDNLLAAKAMLNRLCIAIKHSQQHLPNGSNGCHTVDKCRDFDCINTQLLDLRHPVKKVKPIRQQINLLLQLGRFIRLTSVQSQKANQPKRRYQAYEVFKQALNLAQQHTYLQGSSQALGYIAQLYQDENRYDEALRLTRQAAFLAQQHDDNGAQNYLLYRWQWQVGKLLEKQGKKSEALLAYHQAVETLWAIRLALSRIYRAYQSSFREQVGPLFFDFIALLLEQANLPLTERRKRCHFQAQAHSTKTYQYPCLKAAQDTLEKLKAAELFDYYLKECLIKDQIELTAIELEKQTAVLYPIIFEDRLELLLHHQDKIIRRTVYNTNRNKLGEQVAQFRQFIEQETFWLNHFLEPAQTLYRWLISPIQADLAMMKIDTLIFVPDGILRTMPLAALHDGENYLINHYKIAVVPGLTLTATVSQKNTNQMLLAGLDLTEKQYVRGYELQPLNSTAEIDEIKQRVQGTYQSKTLLNEQFTQSGLKNQLTQKTAALHISSHAVFDAEVKNTFILTKEGPLPLEQFGELFNRTNESPLNLITLSACQTALGDDRAALGLGGIAFRAGVQSAIATLWQVESSFMKDFMPLFYQKITHGLTKAQALQETQQQMMTNPAFRRYKYEHPYFWASVILIGDWGRI
jgi:CHAT domain-containing protein